MPSAIARRLQDVRTAEELHDLLNEIGRDRRSRWTKTQILHYLPQGFHRLAGEYFDEERIVARKLRPLQLLEPNDASVKAALSAAEEFPAAAATTGQNVPTRDDPPLLDELRADPPRGEDDAVGNILQAILAEARCIETQLPKRFRLSDGRCVGPQGDGFIYVFRWSSEPDLFLPGQLSASGQRHAARVGRQSDGERRYELLVDDFIGAEVPTAVFWIDPTFLHRLEFEQLNALRDVYDTHPLAARLFELPEQTPIPDALRLTADGLNAQQKRAVAVVANTTRSYVWGPPGTGKTTSLGVLIRQLISRGKRVLVLSPYNVAVDEAMLSTFSEDLASETLVRFGRASDRVRAAGIDLDSLLEARAVHSGLLEVARTLHASLMREYTKDFRPTPSSVRSCIEELGELLVEIHTNSLPETAVRSALRRLKTLFREPEREILRSAHVLGCTVSLFLLSTRIEPASYDYVLVDEASVMRVPEAVLVALKATGKVAFFGDPKQLPPIVRLRTELTDRWLKPNPFDMAAIHRPDDAIGGCVMLTEQHRMSPPIRSVVSDLFYDGALRDGVAPASGRLVLVDTSQTPARATTRWVRLSQSKENLIHRGVVANCLLAISSSLPGARLLVLSPYLAQKRAYVAEANTNRIEQAQFGTVHASQGRESDIVIIDLVLAPGRGKSRFMNEKMTPEFANLMNVAVSRAKAQLIVVAHCDYITTTYPDGLLQRLIEMLSARGETISVPCSLRTEKVFASLWPAAAGGE